MSRKDWNYLITKNKQELDLDLKEFEKHSEEFDKRIKKIISVL